MCRSSPVHGISQFVKFGALAVEQANLIIEHQSLLKSIFEDLLKPNCGKIKLGKIVLHSEGHIQLIFHFYREFNFSIKNQL